MKWENTLIAYEDDIKSRSFWDWIKAYPSFMKPLHRYKGTLELEKERMIFSGRDAKEGKNFVLEIPIQDITGYYLGFDSVFRRREDRLESVALCP